MPKKTKKKNGKAAEEESPTIASPEGGRAALDPPPRVSRHVQPLGPRVLVRIVERPDRLDSGLYLPATAKDGQSDALLGEVVEVARTQAKTSPRELNRVDILMHALEIQHDSECPSLCCDSGNKLGCNAETS